MRLHARNSTAEVITRIAAVSATAQPNVFQATLSTNADVRRGSYTERLGRWNAFPSRVPLLDSHRRDSVDAVIGYCDNIRTEGGNILADVHISESRSQLVTLVREGALQEVSIGFSAQNWVDSTSGGDRIRTGEGLTLRETSLVVLGADPGARLGRGDDASRIRDLAETLRVPATVAEGLITRNTAWEEARGELISAATRQQAAVTVRTSYSTALGPSDHARAMGEALAHRMGARNELSTMAQTYANDRFPMLCRRLLDMSGISTTGLSEAAIIKRVLTTSDFPILTGEFLNLLLMAGYRAAPSPLMALARNMTVPDFHDVHLARLSQSPLLAPIAETGEVTFGALAESEEKFRVTRWGKGLTISFVLMVNDRLNAVSDQIRAWGYSVAQTEAQQLIALLTQNAGLGPILHDGKPLFDATHLNLLTPAAAPSEDSFDQARVAMRRMTDRFGELLGLTPAYVLCPPELETICKKLVAAITATMTIDVNAFVGWQVLTDPRLTDTERYYFFADPNLAPVFAHAVLSGFESPRVESQIDFMTDNIAVKCTHNFGFGVIDYVGASTNHGAPPTLMLAKATPEPEKGKAHEAHESAHHDPRRPSRNA